MRSFCSRKQTGHTQATAMNECRRSQKPVVSRELTQGSSASVNSSVMVDSCSADTRQDDDGLEEEVSPYKDTAVQTGTDLCHTWDLLLLS